MIIFYIACMTFADLVINFTFKLAPNWNIPKEFEIIYPYNQEYCREIFELFYRLYYEDTTPRRLLLGINPGRFGAGITGVPFTDPLTIETLTNTKNSLHKKPELSSQFILQMIQSMGGPNTFFKQFFIGSVCPLGFTKEGKNCNYYDDKNLYKSIKGHLVDAINAQISFGALTDIAYCIGQGKNYEYLAALNKENHFFRHIEPLPHPRWIMQYQKRNLNKHINTYVEKLRSVKLTGR